MRDGPRRVRVALWVSFVVVHGVLTWLGVFVAPVTAFADVDLYRWWMHLGLDWSTWPVLDGPWVYPAGAIVPMVLPGLVTTTSTAGYSFVWCLLVTSLNAAATAALLGYGATHRSTAGAWWWLAHLALLGPVAIGRLDGVAAPLMVLALVAAVRRPAVAATLATIGAWVKVAPAALLLPLVLATRRPLHRVVAPAAATCAVVAGLVAAGGGLANLTSFLGTQSARDLQSESVGATGWVLARLWRDDVEIVLDPQIVTWEVTGPGTSVAPMVLDALMVLAVAALAGLLWYLRQEGLARAALLPGTFALLVVLIVTNKVGSPQFLAWLAAPVAVLLSRPQETPRHRRRVAAGTTLAAAALTQVVFPWGYERFLLGDAALSVVLAVRNVLLVALLVLAVRWLIALTTGRERVVEQPSATEHPAPEPASN